MRPLSELVADPPRVHPKAPDGVWRTNLTCYEYLLRVLAPDAVTLETGIGLSTAVFVERGCEHTAVFFDPAEGERFLRWASERHVDTSRLTLLPGGSVAALPGLDPTPLDLVFIDGSHSYPLPQLDWYFTAGRLRRGGLVVIDDLQLRAPADLADFLAGHPKWEVTERTGKWAAFRRLGSGSIDEMWGDQGLQHPGTTPSWKTRVARRLPASVVTGLQHAKERIRSR